MGPPGFEFKDLGTGATAGQVSLFSKRDITTAISPEFFGTSHNFDLEWAFLFGKAMVKGDSRVISGGNHAFLFVR